MRPSNAPAIKLTTDVKVQPSHLPISYGQKVWTLGSCFSDTVGGCMADSLLDVEVNPTGPLYNPASVATFLRRVIAGEHFSGDDFFARTSSEWVTCHMHSRISGSGRDEALARANALIDELHSQLPQLRHLILTLGTTRVFALKDSGKVVANCHKRPSSDFIERTLTVQEISDDLISLVGELRRVAPEVHVVLTVSPIRHKMDLHENAVSKGALLQACDEVCHAVGADYFPAFEIMLDELRDYRFYAADMLHPSDVAVEYIFERFAEGYVAQTARDTMAKCRAFTGGMRHRFADYTTPEARTYYKSLLQQADCIEGACSQLRPMLDKCRASLAALYNIKD